MVNREADLKFGSRILMICLLLTAAGLFAAGCSGRYERRSGVRLLYWPSTNPYEIALAERLTTEWNAAHPDTQVVMQPLPEGRTGEEVLIIAAAGKTSPDICSNLPPVIVPLLASAGALVPLDRFPGAREFIRDRLPQELEATFIATDGKLYQIPWKGNPIMVQYNLGMLRECGVEELPVTWLQWEQAAKKICRDLDGDGRWDRWMADIQIEPEWRRRLFDFYTFYIAASRGGTLLKDGQVDFDNEIAVAVFSFFADGFRKGYYTKTIFSSGDVFLQGYVAAHVTGPWNIAHVERLKPEGFEYGFGPIPLPDSLVGSPYTFGDPKSIGIFSTSKHPEAAWAFAKFLISRETDMLLLELVNQLPLRRNLLSDTLYADYFAANPMMKQFAERVPYTRGFDQSVALQEIFDAVSEQFDISCVHNRRSPAEAVGKAAERSRFLLETRGK